MDGVDGSVIVQPAVEWTPGSLTLSPPHGREIGKGLLAKIFAPLLLTVQRCLCRLAPCIGNQPSTRIEEVGDALSNQRPPPCKLGQGFPSRFDFVEESLLSMRFSLFPACSLFCYVRACPAPVAAQCSRQRPRLKAPSKPVPAHPPNRRRGCGGWLWSAHHSLSGGLREITPSEQLGRRRDARRGYGRASRTRNRGPSRGRRRHSSGRRRAPHRRPA
jgi:hypothetical protein